MKSSVDIINGGGEGVGYNMHSLPGKQHGGEVIVEIPLDEGR